MSNTENFPNTSERAVPLTSLMSRSAKALMPEHLAELPGGQWALWRWVAVRGAGFPAARVLQLADPECRAAAIRLVEVDDAAEQVRRQTVVSLQSAQTDEESDVETRTAIRKVLRGIWKGKLPQPDDAPFGLDARISALRAAYVHADSLRVKFYQDFQNAMTRSSQVVYDVASSNLFQEAVIWQNRKAFHNGVAAFLRNRPGAVARNNARRTNEELIATYFQRYCMKNDTIGFFGPVGWAKLVSEEVGLVARPGESLLSKRNVHPERWYIDTLTEMLNEDESLRRWAAPRLLPFFHVEGTTLLHPFKGAIEVSKEIAALLLASGGGLRTAQEIALKMTQDPSLNLSTEEEVFDVLEDLCGEGLILWAFECPVGPQAERYLLSLIERIGDDGSRDDALSVVNELREARARVADAAGDAAKLDESMGELEDTFVRLTGEDSTHASGEIYAGRTLVYEDCERALDVEIGADVLQILGPPLSLLLDSARWFTFEAARRYRDIFTKIYAELLKESGAEAVEAVSFWHRVQPHVVAKDVYILKAVTASLQERWMKVLALPEDERRVNYTTEELRARIGAAFDAPGAGWQLGRYQSPDVMIAAESAEAIGRGDYQLVMGELHLGGNTLSNTIFVHQHPAPSELIAAYEADLPEPCVVPIPPRQWPTVTARTVLALVSPKDYRLALSYDATTFTPEQMMPISAFVVEESSAGLVVRTRDGRISFDIVEFFGAVLSLLAASYFKMLPALKHTPRVTIDRLIVTREAWCFSAGEMEFAHLKEEADRFVELQRWAREHDMPRFVFIKAPIEPKPFYVDLESPILVNFFTKTVRQTSKEASENQTITVTEMIPTPEQLWLPDAEGQLYTAELRMVAIEAPV